MTRKLPLTYGCCRVIREHSLQSRLFTSQCRNFQIILQGQTIGHKSFENVNKIKYHSLSTTSMIASLMGTRRTLPVIGLKRTIALEVAKTTLPLS